MQAEENIKEKKEEIKEQPEEVNPVPMTSEKEQRKAHVKMPGERAEIERELFIKRKEQLRHKLIAAREIYKRVLAEEKLETAEEKLKATAEKLKAKEKELKEAEEKFINYQDDTKRGRLECLLANYGIYSQYKIEKSTRISFISPIMIMNRFISTAGREGCACFDSAFTLECVETICKVACSLANHHKEGHIYYGMSSRSSAYHVGITHFYDRFSKHITQFIGEMLQDARLFSPSLKPKAEIITTQSGDIIHFTIHSDGKNTHEYRGEKQWTRGYYRTLTLPTLEEVQKIIDDEKTGIIPVDLTPANTPVEKTATDSSTDAPEQEGSFDYDKLKKEVKDNDNFKKALETLSSKKEEEKNIFIHQNNTYTFNVDWITGEGFRDDVNNFREKYNKENKEAKQKIDKISKLRKNNDHIANPVKFAIWLGIFAWVGDKNRSECSEKEGSKNNDNTTWISKNEFLEKIPDKKRAKEHFGGIAQKMCDTLKKGGMFSFSDKQKDKLKKDETFANNYTRPIALYIYHWLDAGITPGQAENN